MTLDGPKFDVQIEIGFTKLRVDMHVEDDEKEDGNSDDSEDTAVDVGGMCYLNYDAEIERVFVSRNFNEYGYVALLSSDKFSIYYIYEDGFNGVDKDLIWEFNYR